MVIKVNNEMIKKLTRDFKDEVSKIDNIRAIIYETVVTKKVFGLFKVYNEVEKFIKVDYEFQEIYIDKNDMIIANGNKIEFEIDKGDRFYSLRFCIGDKYLLEEVKNINYDYGGTFTFDGELTAKFQ